MTDILVAAVLASAILATIVTSGLAIWSRNLLR